MADRYSRKQAFLHIGAAAVVLWRLSALRWPHSAMSDPQIVRTLMTGVGLIFVACGLWAFRRRPGRSTLLYALFALTAGLHWGGGIGVGSPELQTWELFVYLLVSSTLGQTLLLHLALVFPRRLAPISRRAGILALYIPVLIGAFLGSGYLLAPGLLRGGVETGLPLLILTGTLFGASAVLVWIGRLIFSPEDRRSGRLGILIVGLLLGVLPYMVVSAAGPLSELDGLFNLFVVLEAVTLAFVLTRVSDGTTAKALEH